MCIYIYVYVYTCHVYTYIYIYTHAKRRPVRLSAESSVVMQKYCSRGETTLYLALQCQIFSVGDKQVI